jgi:3-methyladenine DNA glycosylase AlkD
MPTTADAFVEQLFAGSPQPPMRDVFALAKASLDMPLDEIERLLEHPHEHARMGAVSVMDFLARRKRTPETVRQQLFDLYLRRHDRIDTWGLVDRAAPHVVGGHLAGKPRDVLYDLARSHDIWERRTAIVATYFFIRRDELHDTFAIAELLVDDDEHLIHTAVGGWIREAGKRDRDRLLAFLDRHAATMPRVTLRFAVEHLDAATRKRYLDR